MVPQGYFHYFKAVDPAPNMERFELILGFDNVDDNILYHFEF